MKRLLWILVFLGALFAGHEVAKLQYEINETLSLMDREAGLDLQDVALNNDSLLSQDKIINILLVGADKRESWSEAGRSDSVMIATMDLKHKKLKLTSLMRDMYVSIPGHGETKFNAAYSYGGLSLLYQTIAENFGIKLDGYVVVDFAAFKEVINNIGGVEIELTQKEYEYLITTYANKNNSIKNVKAGKQVLNGTQALAYTRIRQDAAGDFGRTQRQRNVLSAIFKEMKTMSFSEIRKMAEAILPSVVTDLSNDEVVSYLMSMVMMGTTEINQLRIPVDDGYYQDRINGQAVLVLDWDMNRKALTDFIFENSN